MFALFTWFEYLGLKYCPVFFRAGIMDIRERIETLRLLYTEKTGIEPSVLYIGDNEWIELSWVCQKSYPSVKAKIKGNSEYAGLKIIRVKSNSHFNIC